MLAIARVDDIKLVSDGIGGWISVPDIKLPANILWGAIKVPGQNAVQITFATETKSVTTLWHGPHVIGGNKLFFVDAPRRVLQRLKNQLGAANISPLIRVLQKLTPRGKAIRRYCKANGFSVIRNAANRPIGVRPPLVICGSPAIDLDGDEMEFTPELPDLE